MSTDEAWKEIQSKLSQLLADQAFSTFHSFLEKLQQWSSAKQYTPEIYRGFVEIFQKMSLDVQAGNSIPDLLHQASTGGYVQPDWEVHSVYQTNGHIFQFIFDKFRSELGSAQPKPAEIPVVLLVMDAAEAEELATLTAFKSYPAKLRNNFTRLKKRLDKEVPDWQKRYQNLPELWQPFSSFGGATSIKQLVITALDIAQSIHDQRHKQPVPFTPSFKDIRTINNDRVSLKQLRRSGCVIIMDSISMCHPAILQAFQRSLLDAYADTFVVTFAPAYSMLEEVRKMTAAFQFCLADLEFSKRRHDHDEEYGTCKEIWEELEFQHWLKDRLRKTIDRNTVNRDKKDKSILQYVNNFSGTDGGNA